MRKFTLSAIICPILITLSHAAEVWAPGVSMEGGWYDFNKYTKGGVSNGTSDVLKDDGLMCWAVSAANVIAWWQKQNNIKSEYDHNASIIPQGKDVHQTFVAVFNDVGGNPAQAFQWWINGTKNGSIDYLPQRTNFPDEDESSWTSIDGNTYYPGPFYDGGFLTSTQYTSTPFYNIAADPVTIADTKLATNGESITLQSSAIVEALEAGYALSLEVTTGTGTTGEHAITLWGVEYTEAAYGEIKLTKAYITDSDDRYNGIVAATVDPKGYLCEMQIDNVSYKITNANGMRTTVTIPEPATVTLSLLALCGLAARRKR